MSETPSAAATWKAGLWRRICTLWPLKAIGNTVFVTVFFHLYFYIQRHPWFAATPIPVTAIDRWIGFQPAALWLYLSLWVYTGLPVALQPDLKRLARFGLHIGLMCALALAVFALWPTSTSMAPDRSQAGGAFAVLRGLDASGNACPSLHVAAAVFCGLWLHTLLRRIGTPAWLRALNWLWCLAIVYSTLATKQHQWIDVVAGAALGAAGGWLSLRNGTDGDMTPVDRLSSS
ncbi:MAG: phosphatase PAP2 family protein [Burkholderiaceae bacterium]|jgi:membrane-associated phospholipid phosphatase|nr:phosphatase PAP2 family protein [Burkholderiaceae bacterium]